MRPLASLRLVGNENMILEKETYEKFGYYPRDLKPQSNKYILTKCEDCGEIREVKKCACFALCRSCSHTGKNHSMFGKHHTEKTKRKWSDIKRGGKNPMFGRRHTQEAKAKIREARKRQKPTMFGKHHTEETKQKISDALTKFNAQTKYSPAQRHLNRAMKDAICHSLKGTKNGRHWEDIVGYTLADLMITLENDFQPGMSFKNHGTWHIDHIIPLARFKYNSPDDPEFKKAWALNNLQPLWADQNIRKGHKFRFF